MQPIIKIINNALIKQHEHIHKGHVKQLTEVIKKDGCIRQPIIVDKNTMIILDGHHRFNSIKNLGLSSSPCILVDYNSENIHVSSWRKGENVTKDMVRQAGLSGKLLRPKTSKHHITSVPLEYSVPLQNLV